MQQSISGGRPVIFGEVLFDHFPDGAAVLGGAPFNVAWHLRGFGENPLLISRVGDDPTGRRVLSAMDAWGMDTSGVQVDSTYPAGRVRIEWQGSEPLYTILPDQAYDHISVEGLPDCEQPAFLYHGSLALRRPTSRATLEALLSRAPMTVLFDVNLRSPWWCVADIQRWAARAHWVKLNQEELALLCPHPMDLLEGARLLLAGHGLQGVLLTQGKAGATVLTAGGGSHGVQPGKAIDVVDTVGAGDAFTAVFCIGQSRGWALSLTLERAQEFASAIVGVRGATVADQAFYNHFLAAWGQA